MALKRNERYPNRYENPTVQHPQGAFKNRSAPGVEDGSYIEKDWANDWSGFFESLLTVANIQPDGTVDAVGKSQYYNALVKATKEFLGTVASLDVGNGDGQVPDMSYFTSLKNAQGWSKRPDGIIEQWGSATVSTQGALYNFPIPFPNSCFQIVATDIGAGTFSYGVSPISASQFRVYGSNLATPITFRFIAIGY